MSLFQAGTTKVFTSGPQGARRAAPAPAAPPPTPERAPTERPTPPQAPTR